MTLVITGSFWLLCCQQTVGEGRKEPDDQLGSYCSDPDEDDGGLDRKVPMEVVRSGWAQDVA